MINDTNDSIYELFETIVNESFAPAAVNVTEEMLKHGSFVARININKIQKHPSNPNAATVEFDPITINWPTGQLDSQSKTSKSTSLKEAPYVGTHRNSSQFQSVESKLSKNKTVSQKVRFVLKSNRSGKFDNQIQKIDSFLPR